MSYEMDGLGAARVAEYFARIGAHLPHKAQRASFATYAFGILADGERKSAEPIAARACADPALTRQAHDHLLHFLGVSGWSNAPVRLEAARYAIEAMREQESITTWIVDDTGFLKQGAHSVGVQRQYTGSAGKIANCQIGVSLSVATRHEHLPIDFELYLPKSWTEDPTRRQAARIPDRVVFRTKVELAIDMITRAVGDGIPGEVVLADAFYGRSNEFRDTVYGFGLDYAVATDADTKLWLLDARERRRYEPLQAREIGESLGSGGFRRVTWRDGTKAKMASRFAFRRVKVAHEGGDTPAEERAPVWLVIEWVEGEDKPTKFFLTTLPRRMTKKQIVRILKERWRTERVYEDMKGELGLDHFEGRSYPGWHHHVSVVLCCYAFVVAERVRHFPPSRRRRHPASPHACAA
jgi:SRSO17 transposase